VSEMYITPALMIGARGTVWQSKGTNWPLLSARVKDELDVLETAIVTLLDVDIINLLAKSLWASALRAAVAPVLLTTWLDAQHQ
jgi:hypothetical protein